MYTRHKSVGRVVINKLSRSRAGSRMIGEYQSLQPLFRVLQDDEAGLKAAVIAEVGKMSRQVFWGKLRREILLARKDYRRHLAELRNELSNDNFELREDFEQVMERCPELQFAIAVFLPCLVLHETLPGRLLQSARDQDATAIERLIRIDPQIIDCRYISQWKNAGVGHVREGRTKMVAEWMTRQTTTAISRKSFKQSLAGLISLFSLGFAVRADAQWKLHRYKLTAPKIHDLFDAVARDRGRATSAGKDPDLIDCSPEAWAKAVSRYRVAWAGGLKVELDKIPSI